MKALVIAASSDSCILHKAYYCPNKLNVLAIFLGFTVDMLGDAVTV